jgi:hypothetical protein
MASWAERHSFRWPFSVASHFRLRGWVSLTSAGRSVQPTARGKSGLVFDPNDSGGHRREDRYVLPVGVVSGPDANQPAIEELEGANHTSGKQERMQELEAPLGCCVSAKLPTWCWTIWMLSPTSGSHWSEGPLEGLLTRAVPMSCNRHLLMKRILARGGDCRAGFYHPP